MGREQNQDGILCKDSGAEVMPDISMCDSETCPLKTKCYRNPASGTRPSEPVQSWFWLLDEEGEDCDQYWPVESRR